MIAALSPNSPLNLSIAPYCQALFNEREEKKHPIEPPLVAVPADFIFRSRYPKFQLTLAHILKYSVFHLTYCDYRYIERVLAPSPYH